MIKIDKIRSIEILSGNSPGGFNGLFFGGHQGGFTSANSPEKILLVPR